jgi:outer membrane receptor protein involved in Fe transport
MSRRSALLLKTAQRAHLIILHASVMLSVCVFAGKAATQSNIATIRGVVTDQSGAVVQGCVVRISNAINGYSQSATTDSRGNYQLVDVPFNRYLMEVEAPSFDRASRQVTVNASLAQQLDVQLGVPKVHQEVTVSSANELIEPEKSAPATVIDRSWILRFPSADQSRSVEEVIATAPGWTLDAGGRLHARGLEYQVQYSIDGIPVTDTIAHAFGASPDPRSFRSVEVSTASIPAEYGNKLGGLIEVTTRSGRELANQGSATLSGGSFSTVESAFDYGGHTQKFGYFVSAAGMVTDRFLDPPALENFHNQGHGVKSFFKFDYAPNQKDLFRLNLFANAHRFDVPNLPDQESAGQDQWRQTHDNMQSLSWEHVFSTNAVTYLAGYHRYNAAKLRSNTNATPVFAEQTRHHSYYGLLGSLTYQKGRHTIKSGGEFSRFPLAESFTFAITDLDALLEDEPDLPEEVREFTLSNPFFFRENNTGWEGSAYIQDHFKVLDRLTLDAGIRFDSYHFLVDMNYVSPRLGAAYHIERTGTVLRAAYNRFMQTPVLENLLLSSSEKALVFSPAGAEGNDPVRCSTEWQTDLGFQQQLSRYARFDGNFYYRRLKNPAEIVSFLQTNIAFPSYL